VKNLLLSSLLLAAVCTTGYAEMILITKPLPDKSGEMWPREYFNVEPTLIELPSSLTMEIAGTSMRVDPRKTRQITTMGRHTELTSAWVNIIDLENSRLYSGRIDRWVKLDSLDQIRISEGRDTCKIRITICPAPDSCEIKTLMVHDSLKIDDLAYVVFSSYQFDSAADPKLFAKSRNYYRKLLRYFTREVPMSEYLDVPDDTVRWYTSGSNFLVDFKPKSILRIEFMTDN
jgi:hypothetical protein